MRNVSSLTSCVSSPKTFCITYSKRNKQNNRVIYTHRIIRGRKFFSLLSHVSRVVTLANVLHSIKPFKAAPLRSSQLRRPTTQPKSQHVLFNTHSYTRKKDRPPSHALSHNLCSQNVIMQRGLISLKGSFYVRKIYDRR